MKALFFSLLLFVGAPTHAAICAGALTNAIVPKLFQPAQVNFEKYSDLLTPQERKTIFYYLLDHPDTLFGRMLFELKTQPMAISSTYKVFQADDDEFVFNFNGLRGDAITLSPIPIALKAEDYLEAIQILARPSAKPNTKEPDYIVSSAKKIFLPNAVNQFNYQKFVKEQTYDKDGRLINAKYDPAFLDASNIHYSHLYELSSFMKWLDEEPVRQAYALDLIKLALPVMTQLSPSQISAVIQKDSVAFIFGGKNLSPLNTLILYKPKSMLSAKDIQVHFRRLKKNMAATANAIPQ